MPRSAVGSAPVAPLRNDYAVRIPVVARVIGLVGTDSGACVLSQVAMILTPSIETTVTWLQVPPADVISGLHALGDLREGTGRISRVEGESVATYLSWARAALEDAERNAPAVKRHCTEAVSHAKRALDRLFDVYLRRDYLHLQLSDRASFFAKLDLLKRRLGSQIPWRLISDIVADPRNVAEHQFQTPTLQEAGRAVEAASVVVTAMETASRSGHGPALIGFLTGGYSSGPDHDHVYFSGFGSPGFALMWQGADGTPRLAVGRTPSQSVADVIWCPLADLTESEHLGVLSWWDGRSGGSSISGDYLGRKLKLAGIDGPP